MYGVNPTVKNSKVYTNIKKIHFSTIRWNLLFVVIPLLIFLHVVSCSWFAQNILVYAQSGAGFTSSSMSESILKTLVDDAAEAVEIQNTTKALLNLNIVIQALKESNVTSSSIETTQLLLEDAVQAINNNDTTRASTYMNLISDQLLTEEELQKNPASSSASSTGDTDANTIASKIFLTYENTVFGIKIKYPDNWSVRTYPYDLTLNNTVVGFYSPSKTASELGNISGVSGLFVPYLDIFVFSSKNYTLDKIIDEKIKRIQNSTFFLISESKPYTLKGNHSAYSLTYSTTIGKEELFKKIQIYTIIKNKVYLITFTSQDALFSEYLPIAKKMIDSFEFGKP